MGSMNSTEVVGSSLQNGSSEQPDIAIVGELNPDLIVYGAPRELPEEREVLASGFTLTLGSSSAILAHNLALLGSRLRLVRAWAGMRWERCVAAGCRKLVYGWIAWF